MIEGEMIHLTDQETELLKRVVMEAQMEKDKNTVELIVINNLANKLQYYNIVTLRKEERYGK